MSIVSLVLTAIGLAMDAFAVSITIGLKGKQQEKKSISFKVRNLFWRVSGINATYRMAFRY